MNNYSFFVSLHRCGDILLLLGADDQSRNANLLHRSYRYGNLSHSVWQLSDKRIYYSHKLNGI